MGIAKLPVDDAEKFCAWCLSEFRYCDEKTASLPPSGSVPEVKRVNEFWYKEVPSCTEWALNTAMNRFQPNMFVAV